MAQKLFIVDPRDAEMYRALRNALATEPDVKVVYDRRDWSQAGRWRGIERRMLSDVKERIRRDGFAVIRSGPPAERNIG